MKYYLFAGLFIAADQLTKLLVRTNMYVGESICILGDFFKLTHIQNRGAAFSMLSGHRALLILIPLAVIAAALFVLSKIKDGHWSLYASWTLILAGGVGNLIDRVLFGQVTDMLDFSIFPPVFNLADIGVTGGCVLFVIYVLLGDRLKER